METILKELFNNSLNYKQTTYNIQESLRSFAGRGENEKNFLPSLRIPMPHTTFTCSRCHRSFNNESSFSSHALCVPAKDVNRYFKNTMAFK